MDRFTYKKYLEFFIVNNKSIMNKVDKLQVLAFKLKDLKVEIYESFQIIAIVSKSSSTWNDYKKKLLPT